MANNRDGDETTAPFTMFPTSYIYDTWLKLYEETNNRMEEHKKRKWKYMYSKSGKRYNKLFMGKGVKRNDISLSHN